MDEEKYLKLLKEKFPTKQSLCREIINLNAILNLPKGTEHFMSDLHGEYEAFYHILNNCSGVIKEKVALVFRDQLTDLEQKDLCTLIYYPKEKLELLRSKRNLSPDWYRMTLTELIELSRFLSSKYTRSKVRKALPADFSYIIDELLHAQKDEDDNQVLYHRKIIDTIIELNNADEFIEALAVLIKRLAVDHLHIVGDIYDRGPSADRIMELLMQYHSLDIEWGNHDILWMGAACGSRTCVANVVRNNLKYGNTEILERSYGISLRKLYLFSEHFYPSDQPGKRAFHAISVILFKLEAQVIRRHPEYQMEEHLHLGQICQEKGTIRIGEKDYPIDVRLFPTLGKDDPYALTQEEKDIVEELVISFQSSQILQKHIQFLYDKGTMYRIFNQNLLFHGCIPMDEDGNFEGVTIKGRTYKGREYLDYAEQQVRTARSAGTQDALDFMWYLWCGRKSPLSGRNVKLFEKTYIKDEAACVEEKDSYFQQYRNEKVCNMILREFGLYSERSHIINGHTPVLTMKGEQPIRANGRLIVIDGGFCREYHKKTGIAGYTLIFNSHGLRLKEHKPFESIHQALDNNEDIESTSFTVETEADRVMVRNTDIGEKLQEEIQDLKKLLDSYDRYVI